MWKLGEVSRPKAIELLSERLAFARAAVELYDAVLERLHPRGGPYASVRGHLRVIREEKKANQEWLEESVRTLGGDSDQTPGSSLLLLDEWSNVAELLTEEAEPVQLFEALLRAEVYDNGGWEALVDLADKAGDEDAAAEFRQRLHEGQEHFLFVGRIVSRFTRGSVLEEAADPQTTVEAPP